MSQRDRNRARRMADRGRQQRELAARRASDDEAAEHRRQAVQHLKEARVELIAGERVIVAAEVDELIRLVEGTR